MPRRTFTSLSFREPLQRVEADHAARRAMWNLQHSIKESEAVVTIGELPAVRGYESHVIRLFQNLISNAIKYHSDAVPQLHIDAERLNA